MSNILQELETQIADLKTAVTKSNVGTVRQIGDGVAKVEGLSDVMLNEMIEFIATLTIPETNVGGYNNTGWDLVFNLIGCALAAIIIRQGHTRESQGMAEMNS